MKVIIILILCTIFFSANAAFFPMLYQHKQTKQVDTGVFLNYYYFFYERSAFDICGENLPSYKLYVPPFFKLTQDYIAIQCKSTYKFWLFFRNTNKFKYGSY